jgi:hypothetical protein
MKVLILLEILTMFGSLKIQLKEMLTKTIKDLAKTKNKNIISKTIKK